MKNPDPRIIFIVLDGAGAGAMPDAASFGDEGSDTLGHAIRHGGGLELPNLARLGLGNALALFQPPPIPPENGPLASFGLMAEASAGKDTTTGHWELMGLVTETPFPVFHGGYPETVISEFRGATGRGVLGNRPASGTAIIEELGPEQASTGKWIVYTSADSVFQIAAHEEVIPLAELYSGCEAARKILDPLRVSRVIARPFVGTKGAYRRTYNRRDFSLKPPGETVLDRLISSGVEVVGVGKISDIFAGRGVSRSVHTSGNGDGIAKTIGEIRRPPAGDGSFIFVNLVDFDTAWGHRRDPAGFAGGLREFDRALPEIMGSMRPGDTLILSADHGCDPTFKRHTDHTREYVPVLAFSHDRPGGTLGIRRSFADVGASVAAFYGLGPAPCGETFMGGP
jgi:phosphopentomutase